jgi:hypothetical protein
VNVAKKNRVFSSRKPLSELMETFFEVIALPRYGFFTQNVTDSDSSEVLDPMKCFVPTCCDDNEEEKEAFLCTSFDDGKMFNRRYSYSYSTLIE